MDAITVNRPSKFADGDGNPSDIATQVFQGFATISNATTGQMLLAGQRGTKVDNILSLELGLDVQAGDYVIDALGASYEVIQVDNRRMYQRALMRRVY